LAASSSIETHASPLLDDRREVDPLPRDRVMVGPDGSFAIAGLFGERALRISDSGGTWQVDRVRVGRTDVQSVTVSAGEILRDVTIVVSRK
jgi:hypothetical protein